MRVNTNNINSSSAVAADRNASGSQLRLHSKPSNSGHKEESHQMILERDSSSTLSDKIHNLQVQMDRLDCKTREMKEE